eukprot:m.393638 g.393638  ORF g.393638 m.393638 type:complete len:205 (-) comp21087_c1_seq33:6550-7164(-)
MNDLGEYRWVRNRLARQLLIRAANAPTASNDRNDPNAVANSFAYPFDGIDITQLHIPELKSKFVSLTYDEATFAFLTQCQSKTDAVCKPCLDACMQTLLKPFASVTTINGLLGRGQMWVLSTKQFEKLLTFGTRPTQAKDRTTLLDIGAGDGNVTKELASLCSGQVYATETCPVCGKLDKTHICYFLARPGHILHFCSDDQLVL